MQVCTSLQTDNHASTPPLSFLQAGCPSCRPTNSVKALKGYQCYQCFFFSWARIQLVADGPTPPTLGAFFLEQSGGIVQTFSNGCCDLRVCHSHREQAVHFKKAGTMLTGHVHGWCFGRPWMPSLNADDLQLHPFDGPRWRPMNSARAHACVPEMDMGHLFLHPTQPNPIHHTCTSGIKLWGSRRISDPAPLIWDPLPLMTDPVPHNWDPAPFCWDPPLCWVESKHQALFKCGKSQT